MLAEYKTKTNIGVGVGIGMSFAGRMMMRSSGGSGAAAMLGGVIALAGLLPFVWGCSMYAKGKGYSPWFGALGLLSCLGLLVLVLMPDRHK